MAKKPVRSKRKGNVVDINDPILLLLEINSLIQYPNREASETEIQLLAEQGFSIDFFWNNYQLFKDAFLKAGGRMP